MNGNIYTEAYAFTAPVVCGLICMVMMLLDAFDNRRCWQEKKLRLFLALTYLVTSLGWLGMVLFSIRPDVFIYYHTVFLFTLMFDQVMFYRFVFVITDTGQAGKFSRLHVAIPLFLTAASFVSDMVVPVSEQSAVIYGGSEAPNAWYRIVYTLTTLIFVIYNTLYPILNLVNIRRYRRFVVDYSSDVQHTSLDWLTAMQALILICVPVPLAGLLSGVELFASEYFVWLGALPYFVFYLILCHNMLADNYLIIPAPSAGEEELPPSAAAVVNRRQFEQYLRNKKPYLNPKLRVTDLATGLRTNRSYLSSFINQEYGMNFSRMINRCRLRALDRLRTDPANADKSNLELVLMAGFGSYRNYVRVKNAEDRMSMLRIFE